MSLTVCRWALLALVLSPARLSAGEPPQASTSTARSVSTDSYRTDIEKNLPRIRKDFDKSIRLMKKSSEKLFAVQRQAFERGLEGKSEEETARLLKQFEMQQDFQREHFARQEALQRAAFEKSYPKKKPSAKGRRKDKGIAED